VRAILLVAGIFLSACASSSEPSRTAGDVFRDCRDCPEMVAIPSGQFMMDGYFDGDVRRPLHRVSVADFAIGKYEVTFEEWDACVRGGGCASNPSPNDQGWGRGRRPVISVSWNDAQEYLRWLSARTGQAYRLPNTAEWDYADNAPSEPRGTYPIPNAPRGQRGRLAPSYAERDSPETQGTVPVGSYEPNYFGVHDKIGNVSEFTENKFLPSYRDATEVAFLRGQNWYDYEPSDRGFLGAQPVDSRSDWTGFRVARSLTSVRNPNPLPTPLSGPLDPPLEDGYYVFDGSVGGHGYRVRCGAYESPVTLTGEVTLHASRDLAAPVVATARGGESVNIVDCRVHLRPIRGEVLRTDYGFEAGRPVYFLYENVWEFGEEYFEHSDVIAFIWHQGEIIEFPLPDDFPEGLFQWEQRALGQSEEGTHAVCWFELEAHGVRGWGQGADIDCYWTRRWGAAE
jgi:formylglycine-generating enzyme required for sulfatase activity